MSVGCTGLLSPICQAVGGAGSTIAGAGAGAVLGAVATWVVDGASWLLGQIGGALTSTTSVDLTAGWFTSHYQAMAGLAGVVVLPLLLLSTVQAVYRQSAAVLLRVVAVQLPLALVLAGAAVQLVQLSLAATDALGATVSAGVGGDIQQALSGVAGTLVAQAAGGTGAVPTFVLLLGGLLVAFGAFVLWLELLVRAAAVYVAVLFLPLALASLVWPAISHWCRRLVDTLAALVLAKFVIVAVLSLAAAALASGTQAGFASVLGGGALLLLAAFTPFTLLRLVPAVEAGAVHQLEGARHRVQQAFGSMPRSAASFALRAARSSSFLAGEPGTGSVTTFGEPGGDDGTAGGGPSGGAGVAAGAAAGMAGDPAGGVGPEGYGDGGDPGDGDGGFAGIPQWRGIPPPSDADGATRARPAAERANWGIGDPLGHGPMPVWGAPVPRADPDGTERPYEPSMTIRYDEIGPVITPRKPPGGVTGGPGATGGPGGAGGGGGGGGGGGA